MPDARGDIFRGLEIVEMACGTGTLMMGETAENLASRYDRVASSKGCPLSLFIIFIICPFLFYLFIPIECDLLARNCSLDTYSYRQPLGVCAGKTLEVVSRLLDSRVY